LIFEQKKLREKAKKIYEFAKESIGLKYIGLADKYRLRMCLEEVAHSEKKLKEVEDQMRKLLKQIPCGDIIQSIHGVGEISTAIFLGELGDPKYFKSPKQIIKYAGYDPKEHDSGKNIGRKIISKKGRWLLRKILFFMGLGIRQHNAFFRKYYEDKLKAKNQFGHLLKKKEVLCALIIKMIKVIFALLRDNKKFTIDRPVLA